MDLGLTGRVALILASSQGLGKATALSLAKEGADLAICARRQEPLELARIQIEQETGRRILAVPTDISMQDQLNNLVKAAMDQYGRIDILVTNSGPPHSGIFSELTGDDWNASIQSVTMPAVTASRLVIPLMKEREWGRIIHITSTSVKQPLGNLMLSTAARLPLLGLSKMIANEFAPYNISSHVVCPGPFLTEAEVQFFERRAKELGVSPEAAQQEWIRDIPMARIGDPKEFGDVVAFLASERASYMTGTVIQIDGGRVQNIQ